MTARVALLAASTLTHSVPWVRCAEAKCGGAETEKTADRQPGQDATQRMAANGM
jgi:hypothetical protein